jgi:methane/ammonia monooxygenase subunit B
MKTKFLLLIGVIIVAFFVFASYAELEAYGHGVGPRSNAGFYRVEDETFSTTTVSVGESFFINGTLVSLVERDIRGTMDVKFDYTNNDSWFVNLLKSNFSCLGKDMCTKPIPVAQNQNHWYLDIKPKPDAYELKGNDMISYSIEITPLKGGTYHIHTDPDADIDSFRHIGNGQTITVEGLQDITEGELLEFYIPYTIGFALLIIVLVYGVIFVYRKNRK